MNEFYKFKILENNDIVEGKIKCCESGFIFYEQGEDRFGDDDIFGLYFGYTHLLFPVKSKKASWFSGFNNYQIWKKTNLNFPDSIKGELYIDYDIGNWDEKYVEYWQTYYDREKNIICIGDYKTKETDKAVEFCTNIVAVLEGQYLKAIWIKDCEYIDIQP